MSSVSFFDSDYLKAYVDSGLELQIYVKGRYLSVPSVDELVDGKLAVAYDEDGKAVKVHYPDIDHVMIGSITFSKDMMNKPEPESEEDAPAADDTSSEDEDTEE